MSKPVCLDLFCKAGGCTYGYQQAGFYVIGVDIEPQPNYCGDGFLQSDALDVLARLIAGEEILFSDGVSYTLADIALIAASPPCQGYSESTPMAYRDNHPRMIPQVREALQLTGKPYVIENVENARRHLINPLMLCGSMFGLQVWRHRYFEIWPERAWLTPPCNHSQEPVTLVHAGSNSRAKRRRLPVLITGTTRRNEAHGGRVEYSAQECRDASGLFWMTRKEMDEAIPPAYTEFIGRELLESVLCKSS